MTIILYLAVLFVSVRRRSCDVRRVIGHSRSALSSTRFRGLIVRISTIPHNINANDLAQLPESIRYVLHAETLVWRIQWTTTFCIVVAVDGLLYRHCAGIDKWADEKREKKRNEQKKKKVTSVSSANRGVCFF